MSNAIALFTTKEAAQFLGFKPSTLRNSRYIGRLAGVKAPAYKKIGSVCRYDRMVLDNWLAQFKEQTCTSGTEAA